MTYNLSYWTAQLCNISRIWKSFSLYSSLSTLILSLLLVAGWISRYRDGWIDSIIQTWRPRNWYMYFELNEFQISSSATAFSLCRTMFKMSYKPWNHSIMNKRKVNINYCLDASFHGWSNKVPGLSLMDPGLFMTRWCTSESSL